MSLTNSSEHKVMYGAGAKKLATTIGKPESMGAKLKASFYKTHPGIAQLIEDLERAFDKRGWIIGFDQRPLYVRSKMKLLNTLLQHTAAVIFKEWMVETDQWRRAESYYSQSIRQIIAYHDELEYEATEEPQAVAWGAECEVIALRVGNRLGIKVPIEAKAKIGRTWADVH